ncbi:MAG: NUDIX domain-containing protein [Pseudomonadota bacterium]
MLDADAAADIVILNEHDEGGASRLRGTGVETWPVPPTSPPIMIPGIAADGSHYPVEKIEAHIRGLHHRALSVFVFDGDELLIQRRAFGKYHCGGLWANTCCTHPHFGEDIETAAARRMTEELGFTLPMEQRLTVEYSADVGGGLWEREQVSMFRADVAKDEITIAPNPEEVCETRWVRGTDLVEEMRTTPDAFTPWFRIYLDRYPTLSF